MKYRVFVKTVVAGYIDVDSVDFEPNNAMVEAGLLSEERQITSPEDANDYVQDLADFYGEDKFDEILEREVNVTHVETL